MAAHCSRGGGRPHAAATTAVRDPVGDRIVVLYLDHGLSTRDIAAQVGLGRRAIVRRLREADVSVAPRGAGRARPRRRTPEPEGLPALLRDLYEEQRLTRQKVSDRLGISEEMVRSRLREYGIRIRSRGRLCREDRHEVIAEDLVTLYVQQGRSAQDVGRVLGVSANAVLRAAHEMGLPVRLGNGTPPRRGPSDIELIRALYADPLVGCALDRHHVPRAAPGGPICQRFPEPVPLTPELLLDLYVTCGLSVAHLELLTGQPCATLLHHLRAARVPMRPAGGRCPFRRRWRDDNAGVTR